MTSHAAPLESRLFRHYWDDGLLDLFAGVGAIGIGVLWAFDLVVFGAIFPALLAVFWQPLRRTLVEPRAGAVEFSDARRGRTRRLLSGSVLLGVAMLAVFTAAWYFATDSDSRLSALAPGLPAFLLGLLAALSGVGLGLPRFLAYAGVFCAGGVGVAIADARPEVAIVAGGLVVLATGARLLVRLLRLDVVDEAAN